jgi:hypothetical protein
MSRTLQTAVAGVVGLAATVVWSSDAKAQQTPLLYPDQRVFVVSISRVELLASACRTEVATKRVIVPTASALDESYSEAPHRIPGVELVTLASGNATYQLTSRLDDRGNLELTFTLRAQGGGVLSADGACADPRSAGLNMEVFARYRADRLPSVAKWRAPDPDLRLAIDWSPIRSAVANLAGLQYGKWIRLGEFGCGDRNLFPIRLQSASAELDGQLQPTGAYQAGITTIMGVSARIFGCFGDPAAVSEARLRATVASLREATIPLRGSVGVIFSFLPVPLTFPISLDVPIPGGTLSQVPIVLADGESDLAFVRKEAGNWVERAPDGKRITVPLSLNAGAVTASDSLRQFFILDATIGAPRFGEFMTAKNQLDYFRSDVPVWSSAGTLGMSVHQSLFGARKTDQEGTGLMGYLLPIRVKGVAEGRFLFWKIRKPYEIVLDSGQVSVSETSQAGGAQVRLTLGSSHARIDGKTVVADKAPVKGVQAVVVLDVESLDERGLRFVISRFQVGVKMWRVVIPIRLRSAELQKQLNGGLLPLTDALNMKLELPKCIETGWNKIIAPPCICNATCTDVFTLLGYEGGYRAIRVSFVPGTGGVRQSEFSLDGIGWRSLQLQAGLKVEALK